MVEATPAAVGRYPIGSGEAHRQKRNEPGRNQRECDDAFCKHRTTLAALPADVRERAWKVLCERCVDAGQKNAKAWLKRYIAEADAKAAKADAPAATEVTP